MREDTLDETLKTLGTTARASRWKIPPLQTCPDEADLERFATHELPPEDRAGLETHLADCPRCSHLVSHLARVDAPLEATAERRIEAAAREAFQGIQLERQQAAASAGSAVLPRRAAHEQRAHRPPRPGIMARLHAWSAAAKRHPGWAVPIACLLLLGLPYYAFQDLMHPGTGHPDAELASIDPSSLELAVAGADQTHRGVEAMPQASSDAIPAFARDSIVQLLVQPRSMPLAGAVGTVVAVRADGRLVPLPQPFVPSEGLWTWEAPAAQVFGAGPGRTELWVVVTPPGQVLDLDWQNLSPDDARAALDQGRQKGRWWWSGKNVEYRLTD